MISFLGRCGSGYSSPKHSTTWCLGKCRPLWAKSWSSERGRIGRNESRHVLHINQSFSGKQRWGWWKLYVKRPSEHRPIMLVWSTTGGRRGLHTLWPPLAENVTTNSLPYYYSWGLTLPINIIVNINRNVNMTVTLNRNRNTYDWVVLTAFSALFIVILIFVPRSPYHVCCY